MPFGFGFGELVAIGLIVVVVFGSTKLPNLGERLRDLGVAPGGVMGRWTWGEWLLVAAIVVAAASVLFGAVARGA
jgi:Sec-independent protein translocase protein TatA